MPSTQAIKPPRNLSHHINLFLLLTPRHLSPLLRPSTFLLKLQQYPLSAFHLSHALAIYPPTSQTSPSKTYLPHKATRPANLHAWPIFFSQEQTSILRLQNFSSLGLGNQISPINPHAIWNSIKSLSNSRKMMWKR